MDVVVSQTRARSHWIIVFLIWFLYSANLVFWESMNRRVVGYDEVCHFGNSVAFWKAYLTPLVFLQFGDFLTKLSATQPLCLTIGIYPPLIYAVTGLFYFVLPPTLQAAAISNIVFLFILIVSTFKLTDDLVGRMAGYIAAFLVGSYPIIIGTTRYYYLDFGTAAIVALTFLLMEESQRFQNLKIDVLLGVTLLAGMLSKDTYPLYVVVPLVYLLIKARRNKLALLNAVGVLAIMSISALWYLRPGELSLLYNYNFIVPQIRGDLASPLLLAPVNHLRTMILFGTGFVLFAIFCVGLPFLLRNPKARAFCVVALLGGFLFLGFTDTRYFDPRFTMPFLPLLALTSASLFKNYSRRNRAQVIALVVIVSLVGAQYASISFNTPMLSGLLWPTNTQTMVAVYPPSRDDWKVSEIVQDIGADASYHQINHPVVMVPVEGAYFDDALFLYYAYVDRVNLTINTSGFVSASASLKAACTANYTVLRTSANQSELIGGVIGQNIALVSSWVTHHISNYSAIGNYTLPDGSVVHLYRRVNVMDCSNPSMSIASSAYNGTPLENVVLRAGNYLNASNSQNHMGRAFTTVVVFVTGSAQMYPAFAQSASTRSCGLPC